MRNKNKMTEIWNQIEEKNVNVIAGRPSVGKGLLLMKLVSHAAINCSQSVYVVSLSKHADELAMDILCNYAQISPEKKQNGKLTTDEWKMFSKAFKNLIHANIHFSDDGTNSLKKIEEEILKFGSETVIIDIAELLPEFAHTDNRKEKYQNLISAMRDITKRNGITLISFFTLTREPIKKHIERLNPQIIISENSPTDKTSKENLMWIEPMRTAVFTF